MLSIQSPYSGEALVLDVPQPFIYNSRKDICRNVSNAEIGIWLNSHGEVRKVEVNQLDELKTSLNLYYGCRKALQLALFSVDSDLDSASQQKAITLLESFLENSAIFDWLMDLFCIQELPQPSIEILNQSLRYANQNAFQSYISFYTPIYDKQSEIKVLANSWKQVEQSLVFENYHQDLLDSVLGTGLFKRIIDKVALLKISELILLVLLKVRPNLDLDYVLKIIPKSINFNFFSNILGFEDTIFGIDNLSLWMLVVGKSPALILTPSYPEQTTPFECCNYNNHNITVSSLLFPDNFILFDLVPNLKTYLESFTDLKDPSSENNETVPALEKVKRWGNRSPKGACQCFNPNWLVRS
jgi:hypothetical protein